MTDDNLTGIALILLVLFLIVGFSQGWFQSTTTETIITNTEILKQLEQPASNTCSITFSKNPICRGEAVQGTARGTPNDVCDLYYRIDGGAWFRDTTSPTFHLDSSGIYRETRTAVNAGTYEFKAICSKCIMGGTLRVNDCGEPEPTDCNDKCTDLGYAGGYAGACNKPWYYDYEVQVGDCCCHHGVIPVGYRCYDTDGGMNPEVYGICYDEAHPSGMADSCISGMEQWVGETFCSGGVCVGASTPCPKTTQHCVNGECVEYDSGGGGSPYGGYSNCEAWATAMGKEFWATPDTSLDECYDNAWGYCDQFGWYLVAYDWDGYDCCIWECSGGWD